MERVECTTFRPFALPETLPFPGKGSGPGTAPLSDIMRVFSGPSTRFPTATRMRRCRRVSSEASLDFDFGSSIFLEGGKKKEKLGSGYFRHPVDIMVVDPVASRSSVGEDADRTREGLIGFGAMHVTPEYSFRLFLSPAMRWSDSGWIGRAVSSQQRLNQLFAKGTTRIGEVDLDVIYRHVIDTRDDGQASSLGGNVAGSYGDFFSWHAEGLSLPGRFPSASSGPGRGRARRSAEIVVPGPRRHHVHA